MFIAIIAFFAATASANPFAPAQQSRKAAANSQYINNLVSAAVPTKNSQLTRRLDQQDQEDYEVNISAYSVKFEQCQFVKSYNDELAQDADSATVLATKRFVLFRLCPDDCSSCNYNYGEYLVSLDDYLQYTVEYYQNYQENVCQACGETCEAAAADDAVAEEDVAEEEDVQDEQEAEGEEDAADEAEGGRKLQNYYTVDCNSCVDECQKIEDMEANGYIDATAFLECSMIYGPEDDNKAPLYAGPICASSGTKIKIGVFTDENCMYEDSSKEVDDYLVDGDGVAMKLSHNVLKSTYTNTCISCMEPEDENDNNQGNDNEDNDKVIEMCERLYDDAAKCETSHGFDNGYANYNGYENQLAQESVVCDYMQSLKSGTYDESGEIIVSGSNSMRNGSKSTTGGQKFALTFFIIGTVGLAVYAAVLHSKLVKGGGKVDLSGSGGAMA